MADVAHFTVDDLERFSKDLRTIGTDSDTMTSVAQRISDYLYDNLQHADGTPQCVLVALYKTHLFARLPERLRTLATEVDPTVEPTTACLTRLASTGVEDPNAGPEALIRPLTEHALASEPILGAMLRGMGLDLDVALDPDRAASLALHHRDLGIFFVPDVLASEWVDDAETAATVTAMGLRALLGIGGALPTGDLYFAFWFTNTEITERSGDLMRSLAPAIKAALIPSTLEPFGPE